MSTAVTTKRDVREQIKVALQPLLDDATIDLEELKAVTKSASDAIGVPTTVSDVHVTALGHLESLLAEQQATADVLERVKSVLSRVSTTAAGAAAAADPATPPATLGESAPQPALSFDAFRARMARKKEELQAKQRSSPVENTPPPTAAAAAAPTLPKSGAASGQQSVGTSPALGPAIAPAEAQDEVLSAKLTDSHSVAEQPVEKKARTEAVAVVLTAAPFEDDLYADLRPARERRGRGRGRGGAGRGSGGPMPQSQPHGYYPSSSSYGSRGGYSHYYPPH